LAAYRESVLNAVKDVQDALVREAGQAETVAALVKQLDAARQSEREADRRYRKGAESYLSVLNARLGAQDLERSLADARYQHAAYRVQLYRALGGGDGEPGEEGAR
jgi:outer membrane protein TolC